MIFHYDNPDRGETLQVSTGPNDTVTFLTTEYGASEQYPYHNYAEATIPRTQIVRLIHALQAELDKGAPGQAVRARDGEQ